MSDYAVGLLIQELGKLGIAVSEGLVQAMSFLWPLAMRQVFVVGVRVVIFSVALFALGIWIICCYRKTINKSTLGDYDDTPPVVFGWILLAAGLFVAIANLDVFLNPQWLAVNIVVQRLISP